MAKQKMGLPPAGKGKQGKGGKKVSALEADARAHLESMKKKRNKAIESDIDKMMKRKKKA